jgi:hypothetical protein
LIEADGTGGTRYMPLAFVVHSVFIRLGFDVITSGFALGFAWAVALVVGLYQFLRSLKFVVRTR